jgi:DNA-directed RNA polymerase subunit M/transcription elongation factor TFIIS
LGLVTNCYIPGGAKQFQCPSCEQLYPSPKLLVQHIHNNHKAGDQSDVKKCVVEPQVQQAEIAEMKTEENFDEKSEPPTDRVNNNRNKANVESDDEGSDTSADESDEEEKTSQGIRGSFPCPYCKDTKTIYTTRWDIVTLSKRS